MMPIYIYIVAILLGGISGFWIERLTRYLIEKRISEPIDSKFPKSIVLTSIWVVLNSIFWLVIVYVGGITFNSLELVLVLSACLSLSVVDIVTRKIPNQLILFLLIVGTLFVFINNQISSINLNLIGFAVGFILFLSSCTDWKGSWLGRCEICCCCRILFRNI